LSSGRWGWLERGYARFAIAMSIAS
jgi:hypothetical protein